MNYLITGSNGFIGKDIFSILFRNGHDVATISRQDIDLSDSKAVKSLPGADVLVHCASSICRRHTEQSSDILYNNLLVNENILSESYKYKKVFILGSGAEFNQEKDVMAPDYLKKYNNDVPNDYYGLSKYVNCLRAKEYSNVVYIRLFMVFGLNEPDDRFVKSTIFNVRNDDPVIIHKDKIFGAISTYDLAGLLNPDLYENHSYEFNACYNPISLVDLTLRIASIFEKKPTIKLPGSLDIGAYYGQNQTFQQLSNRVNILGLNGSLRKLIHEFHESMWLYTG